MITLDIDLNRGKYAYGTTIITIPNGMGSYECLIDTGAYEAIWSGGITDFLINYPNAKKTSYVAYIGGFGKGRNIAPIYIIDDFILSDGNNEVHYKDIPIAILDKDYSFSMILGYSLFNKANISINTYTNRNGMHRIHPHMIISYPKQEIYVGSNKIDITKLPVSKQGQFKENGITHILESIYTFSQE